MTLLIGLAGLMLLALYIYLLSRRVDIGMGSLLAVELYNLTMGLDSSVIGGVHLNPLDIVSISLLIAGAIRTSSALRRISQTRILALIYVALVLLSVARGLSSYRILSVFNESRGFKDSLIGLLYFMTAPTDESALRKYLRLYLSFGFALCVVAGLAAAGMHVGMIAAAKLDQRSVDGRYLSGAGASAIAICGFVYLAKVKYLGSGYLMRFLPIMFMCVAIYLRHRTVWVMVIAGTAVLFLVDRKLFRRLVPLMVCTFAGVAVLAFYGTSTTGLIDESRFSKSATDDETWVWRVNSWEALLADGQTPLTVISGKNMGSGYSRIDPVTGGDIEAAPHSEYIQEYLRAGVLGVGALLLVIATPLVLLWKWAKIEPAYVYPSCSAWVVVLVMALAYGVTYSIASHIYVLIGIANAIVIRQGVRTRECALENSGDWTAASEYGAAR